VQQVRGLPGGLLRFDVDPHRALVVGTGQGIVGVVDFAAGTTRAYTFADTDADSTTIFEPCTDGRRAFGIGDRPMLLALDTGAVTEVRPIEHKGWAAAQGCLTTWRFEHETFEEETLTWWDAKAGAARLLATDVAQAWATPDGRHAISIDEHGGITLWDPERDLRGTPLGRGPSEQPVWPAVSDDGRVVVFPWEQPLVLIGGKPIEYTPSHIDATAVTPDGSRIAYTSGHDDLSGGDVELRDGTGLPDGGLAAAGAIRSLDFSPDGAWLFATGDRPAAWELATRLRVALPLPGEAYYSLAGHQLAVVTRDGTATLWEPRPAHVRRAIEVGQSALSRDGRWLIVETLDRITRVDLSGRVADESFPTAVIDVAVLDGNSIAEDGSVLLPGSAKLWLWRPGAGPVPIQDVQGLPTVRAARGGQAMIDAAVVELGATGATAARPVWSLPAGLMLYDESPDLDRFAVRDPKDPDGGIRVLDRATGAATAVPGSQPPATFSRDGRWLVAAAASGEGVVLWDVAARRAQPLPGPRTKIDRLFVSDDARHVAIVAPTAAIVLDRGGAAPRVLDLGAAKIVEASFDRDGGRLAIASDRDARLWDLGSGAMRVIADAPAEAVHFDGDAITILLQRAVIEVSDDLPRDPAALSAALRAQPYELEETPGGAARVRMRR
jgi:hypothetical protein